MNDIFLHSAMQIELGGYTLHLRPFDVACYSPQQPLPYSLTQPDDLLSAVTKRQAEFMAGRVAACDALQAAGVTPQMLSVGKHRAPQWPEGVVGSISHNENLALAVAQYVDNGTLLLGADVESWIDAHSLSLIQTAIADPQEAAILDSLSLSTTQRITTLFSAKESLFKALYPRVRRYLDFQDSRLIFWNEPASYLLLQLTHTAKKYIGDGRIFRVDYQWNEEAVVTLAQLSLAA
ncbi:4'-phosphopantetheinyl transferase family protein [Vibrio cincinnatiensis]|uniref:4'-phosphopantetheinyl transferase family protein n=1 Tax=Vibrio cincinnatiensis TaxID=675 RepID=UPI001EDF8975|nr:4'-phosphopantetheinyl transferase superfamily protein [Vibrio cincinnatiensis]MCG3734851.1 4'-phosphopantetheinyl transferase superfamily protein [Vibrio cincinnatiensis]